MNTNPEQTLEHLNEASKRTPLTNEDYNDVLEYFKTFLTTIDTREDKHLEERASSQKTNAPQEGEQS
ncbi:MAG: hypothetical protein ACRCYY_10770 [Trueperaceae bacterium]